MPQVEEILTNYQPDVLWWDTPHLMNQPLAEKLVKLLTLITVITTPVTLVSGWYGMNFAAMHELRWDHAYACLVVLTFLATAGTYIYFKRKHWL